MLLLQSQKSEIGKQYLKLGQQDSESWCLPAESYGFLLGRLKTMKTRTHVYFRTLSGDSRYFSDSKPLYVTQFCLL
jgi:hypothetical protein